MIILFFKPIFNIFYKLFALKRLQVQTAAVAADGSVIMSDSRSAADPVTTVLNTTSTTADVAPHEQEKKAPAATATAETAEIPAPAPAPPADSIVAAPASEESFIAERDDTTTTTTTSTSAAATTIVTTYRFSDVIK